MKLTLGKVKFLLDRQKNYMAWFNTGMIAYLFFQKVEFKWYYIAGVFCLICIMMLIDTKYIIPGELDYSWYKNPGVKELLKLVGKKDGK